jgi:sugar lactone lactonase YvrE
VLIDPAGNVVGGHSGEGVYEVMQPIVASLVDEFEQKGVLDRTPIEFAREVDGRSETALSYPGKVFVDPNSGILYIADTGHHRVVAADPVSGDVLAVYGSGRAGYDDDAATAARFDSPQGMALSPDGLILYVADTNNHAVRSIELATGTVGTALGTGEIGWPPIGGSATDVSINSPWALEQKDDKLYIAMAGHHQIWEMDLASDVAQPLVGSSRESTVNGPLALAELAQPSGLAFDDSGLLYFADSESSAIRSAQVDSSDGVTAVVVGSDANLFDFGDVDGAGTEARLQHPLGLAYATDGFMYVADTYNSKLKRIDLPRQEVSTFLGGEQGWRDGSDARFYEPGGLAATGDLLYVADTNNHVVRVVDLTAATAATLVLKGIERFQPPPDAADYQGETVQMAAATVAPGTGTLEIAITLPPDHKVNEEAPSSAQFFSTGGVAEFGDGAAMSLTGAKFPVTVPVQLDIGTGEVTADLTVIYCREGAESLCFIQQLRLKVPVTVAADGSTEAIRLEYTVSQPNV